MPNDDETTPPDPSSDVEGSKRLQSSSSIQPFLSVHVPYNSSPAVIANAIAKALQVRDVPPPFFKDRTMPHPLAMKPELYQSKSAAPEADIIPGPNVDYKALLILVQEEGGVLGPDI